MALPLPWVNRIFDKLLLAYGRDFTGRWEGLDIATVKTDWAHELSGFEQHPEAIKHALQHLPASKSPTVYEFRNLCVSAPNEARFELSAPPADPVFVAAIAEKLRHIADKPANSMKEWAYTLKTRYESGGRLNVNQIRCYRAALGLEAA